MHTEPILKYTSDKELRCVFFTLVIRADALRKKYRGGLKAFMAKYDGRCNRDLVVMCAMAGGDLDQPYMDIRENGLESEKDYVCVEAVNFIPEHLKSEIPSLADPGDHEIAPGWLRGYYHRGGKMVYYAGATGAKATGKG